MTPDKSAARMEEPSAFLQHLFRMSSILFGNIYSSLFNSITVMHFITNGTKRTAVCFVKKLIF